MKRKEGTIFGLSPFGVLALYSSLEPRDAHEMITLDNIALDLQIPLDNRNLEVAPHYLEDNELLDYFKQSRLANATGNKTTTIEMPFRILSSLSRKLRYSWATTMTDPEQRKTFMQQLDYLDETSAMHELTGNGVSVGEAYTALNKQLQQYVLLGMIPRTVLTTLTRPEAR